MNAPVFTGYRKGKRVVKIMDAVEHTIPGLNNGAPALFVRHNRRWWMLSRPSDIDGARSVNVAPDDRYQLEIDAVASR